MRGRAYRWWKVEAVMNRIRRLKSLLSGIALALATSFGAYAQEADDEPMPGPRRPLAQSPSADLLIREFYAWYPCVSPTFAIGFTKSQPEVARAIVASDRPDRDRYAAYVCLVSAKVPGYKELIKRGISDRSEEIRRSAVHQLPYAIPEEQLAGEYIRLLNDPWKSMRYYAAEGLARYPSKDALEPLLKLLADESVETRHIAVSTLLKWNDNDAKMRLRELAGKDDVTVAGAALSGLARDKDFVLDLVVLHSYLDHELQRLTGPPYSGTGIVVHLIDIVAKKGDARSLSILETATHHQHSSVRDAAVRAINELKNRMKD
jgi:HEAT repeat protein